MVGHSTATPGSAGAAGVSVASHAKLSQKASQRRLTASPIKVPEMCSRRRGKMQRSSAEIRHLHGAVVDKSRSRSLASVVVYTSMKQIKESNGGTATSR